MLKTLKFRLIFGVALLVLAVISFNALLTKPVNGSNTSIVKLHLKSINQESNRGEFSYNIYVLENNEHYKIGADDAHCFDYATFDSKISQGELVEMQIKKDNGFLAPYLRSVVSLVVNNHEYVSSNCINERIADNKTYLPVFGFLGLILIYILFYNQEQKDLKKNVIKRTNPPYSLFTIITTIIAATCSITNNTSTPI